MDPTVAVSIIAGIGTLISGFLVYLGTRYTQRQVARADARSAELEAARVRLDDERVDLERIESLGKEVKDLRLQMKEDRADHHAEIAQLRNEHAAQMDRMTRRIEDLESKRAGDRTAITALSTYARTLLRLLQLHQIEYPAPPENLLP